MVCAEILYVMNSSNLKGENVTKRYCAIRLLMIVVWEKGRQVKGCVRTCARRIKGRYLGIKGERCLEGVWENLTSDRRVICVPLHNDVLNHVRHEDADLYLFSSVDMICLCSFKSLS